MLPLVTRCTVLVCRFSCFLIYYELSYNLRQLSGDRYVNIVLAGLVDLLAMLSVIPLNNTSVTLSPTAHPNLDVEVTKVKFPEKIDQGTSLFLVFQLFFPNCEILFNKDHTGRKFKLLQVRYF